MGANNGNEPDPQGNNEAHNEDGYDPHHYEKLNFVIWDNTDDVWVCQVNGCGKRFPSNQGMSKHVSRIHTNMKTANRKKCPYCPKYYAHLKDMLMHLAITKNVIREGGWANAICAHMPVGGQHTRKMGKIRAF